MFGCACACSFSYIVLSLIGGGTPNFSADLGGRVYST